MCALSVCHEEGIGPRTLRDIERSKVLKSLSSRGRAWLSMTWPCQPCHPACPLWGAPNPGGCAPVPPRPLQRAPTLPQLPPLVSGEIAPHHLTTQPRGPFWYFLLPSLFSPPTDLLTLGKCELLCVLMFYPDSCVHHCIPFSGAWETFYSLLCSDPARCLVFVDL